MISRGRIRKLYGGLDYKRLRNYHKFPRKKPDDRINYVGGWSPSPRFLLSPQATFFSRDFGKVTQTFSVYISIHMGLLLLTRMKVKPTS